MTTLDPDACPACGGSPYAPDGVSRCPRCRGTGTAAGAPVSVDVPPGTPLHELARSAADAPEVRPASARATPQTVAALRRAVAYGLANGKTNMVADLAPLSELLAAHDAMLEALRLAAVWTEWHAGDPDERVEAHNAVVYAIGLAAQT